MTAMSHRLLVDPTACTGHGLCAELLPELVALDEWGYPVLDGRPVPASLRRSARRAVTACPALALILSKTPRSAETQSKRIMHP
jgi:ferredoxin